MSLLPSLANLFAYYDPAPRVLRRVRDAMRLSGDFDRITTAHEGWIVGWKCLPDSDPIGREFSRFHLAFAEGRDRLAEGKTERAETWQHLARIVTRDPAELVRFPGDFGFVHFRPRGQAAIVRSCGGLAPFYFWQDGEQRGISTLYTWLVRFLPRQFELDPLPNAIWAMGHAVFPDNRTFMRGISVVPRGYSVTLNGSRKTDFVPYWDPRPDDLPRRTPNSEREHAERLRGILFQKLETELHPAGGNLLTLSGGVDSSCLAALATRSLGKKIGTFSVVPAPEDLLAREMSFIRPLIEHPNVERCWFLYVDGQPLIDLLEGAPPVAFHIPHPALCKLPEIHREWPVRVLFGGEWADETCGSNFMMEDWKDLVPIGHLLRQWFLGELPVGPLDPLRVVKHRLRAAAGRQSGPFAPMPPFFSEDVRAEYREWVERRLRVMRADPRPWRHLSEHLRQNDGYIAMNWEAASALGIRRSLPFVSREILELTYSCRPEEMLGPKTKKLLRRALHHDVPHRHLYRSNKSAWGAALRRDKVAWERPLPSILESLLRRDWMPRPAEPIDAVDAGHLGRLERAAVLLTSGCMATNMGRNFPLELGGQRL